MSRRASFRPEPFFNPKHGGAAIKVGCGSKNKKRAILKIWILKLPNGPSRFSLVNFFRNVGAKVSKAMPAIPARRKCSGRISSSASLARSRSYAETLGSHRAEAIEDCIHFFHNSSLQRSISVNSSC